MAPKMRVFAGWLLMIGGCSQYSGIAHPDAFCETATNLANTVTRRCPGSGAFVQPPHTWQTGGVAEVTLWLLDEYDAEREAFTQAVGGCMLAFDDSDSLTAGDCSTLATCLDDRGIEFPASYPEPASDAVETECGVIAAGPPENAQGD